MSKLRNYLHFLLYVLSHPEIWKYLLKGLYLPVVIEYLWVTKYQINTFIDVGAHEGAELNVIKEFYPESKIYAFEPLPEYTEMLRQKKLSDVQVIECAISDKKGKADFYVNSYAPASSLLEVNSRIKKSYKLISKSKKISVQTTSLDMYFRDIKLSKPIFLKLDIQGAESIAIRGGEKTLEQVAIVFIETAFDPLYVDQETFSNIYKLLHSRGFEFKGIQMDGVFEPQFSLPPRVNCIFINNKNI